MTPKDKSLPSELRRRAQRERHALGASISSAALLSAAASSPASPTRTEFSITDLLPDPRALTTSASEPHLSPLRASDRPGKGVNSQVGSSQPLKPTQSQQPFVERLHSPENVELFAYSSALCHRLTGRYLPSKVLQQDPAAQQSEIARIQQNPKLLRAIDAIRTLSKQFKDVARDTIGHRKELGHTLFRIEESYLKLFESLLEISLGMYWSYEQSANAERVADKVAIKHWQEMHGWKTVECNKLAQRLEAKEILARTLQIELDELRNQITGWEERVRDHSELEQRFHVLMEAEARLRSRECELQSEVDHLQRVHNEMLSYERKQQEEMRSQQKRLVDELKKSLREKEKLVVEQDSAIRELTVAAEPVSFATRSSQTVVDDDGLWDARDAFDSFQRILQDGIPRVVSKSAVHRIMWRRFNAYVTCTNCGGRPLPRVGRGSMAMAQGAETQDFADVWSLLRSDKISKKLAKRIGLIEQQWELPEAIVLFLSNLPKSVMAFPFYPLDLVIAQIEKIYNDKFESDQVDESDGVAQEELPKFICEYFLKSHELRQSAEVELYRFLISVKNEYLRHPHVHLFARFSDLLRRDYSTADSTETPSLDSAIISASTAGGYLDRSFLRVYLAARHYLLRPPPQLRGRHRKAAAALITKRPVKQIPHVIQVDKSKPWVPLDHAIALIKWYINCLPEEVVVTYCREVEHNTAIYAGGAITEVSGNRLAVRAEMRRAMLVNAKEVNPAKVDDGKDHRFKPLIVADVHKVLLLLITALEQRQAVMAKDLVALFDAGDINHDRVLSLTEFTAIIRNRMPHFSDRRVLRMFREALMSSADQSFALSMGAFVQVCSDHGLVSLLPDDRMRDPFEPIITQTQRSRASSTMIASALEALADPKHLAADPSTTGVATARTIESDAVNSSEIPEELPDDCQENDAHPLSARAAEVEEEEDGDWQW